MNLFRTQNIPRIANINRMGLIGHTIYKAVLVFQLSGASTGKRIFFHFFCASFTPETIPYLTKPLSSGVISFRIIQINNIYNYSYMALFSDKFPKTIYQFRLFLSPCDSSNSNL